MRKIILGIGMLVLSLGLLAQQEPQYNQYMYNKVFFNPAAAGASGAICGGLIGREQWLGLKDEGGNNISPSTYGLSFDMPIYHINSGVGLSVQYDGLGFEKTLDLKLMYAYQHVFANSSMLGIGLGLNIINKSIDYAELYPWDEDPSLPGTTVQNGTMTDVDLGIHFQKNNKYYMGISATNLLGSSADIGGVDFNLARHYYLYGGYDITLKDSWRTTLVLTPGLMARATSGSAQLDLNAILTYNNRIWGGLLFKVDRAVGAIVGFTYKGFNLGVSYDYSLRADIATGHKNSVELFVKYCYPIKPKPNKISGYNTRNL